MVAWPYTGDKLSKVYNPVLVKEWQFSPLKKKRHWSVHPTRGTESRSFKKALPNLRFLTCTLSLVSNTDRNWLFKAKPVGTSGLIQSSKAEPPSPDVTPRKDSQNCRVWKWPLKIMESNLPAKAGILQNILRMSSKIKNNKYWLYLLILNNF